MGSVQQVSHKLPFVRLIILVPLAIAGLVYIFSRGAYGAELPQRSLMLSDNEPSAIASYELSFTMPASETLGSIELQLCGNSPLATEPCDPPSGFDSSLATLDGQNGETGFSILPTGTNANTIVLSRVPSATVGGTVSYAFGNVTNPSANGPFYGRIQTFASADASGPSNDFAGVAMSTGTAVNVSTTVPPYLLFCSGVVITGFDCSTASGDYINFGDLTSTTTGSAQSQVVTASNAANGFAMSGYGTTMTSGNNIIDAMAAQDVSRPGISQFGLNLVHNATPNVGEDPQGAGDMAPTASYATADWYRFVSGDVLASVTHADSYKRLTLSYIINIAKNQPAGVYATTLTYVCLANF